MRTNKQIYCCPAHPPESIGLQRLTAVIDHDGNRQEFTLDTAGNVIGERSARDAGVVSDVDACRRDAGYVLPDMESIFQRCVWFLKGYR